MLCSHDLISHMTIIEEWIATEEKYLIEEQNTVNLIDESLYKHFQNNKFTNLVDYDGQQNNANGQNLQIPNNYMDRTIDWLNNDTINRRRNSMTLEQFTSNENNLSISVNSNIVLSPHDNMVSSLISHSVEQTYKHDLSSDLSTEKADRETDVHDHEKDQLVIQFKKLCAEHKIITLSNNEPRRANEELFSKIAKPNMTTESQCIASTNCGNESVNDGYFDSSAASVYIPEYSESEQNGIVMSNQRRLLRTVSDWQVISSHPNLKQNKVPDSDKRPLPFNAKLTFKSKQENQQQNFGRIMKRKIHKIAKIKSIAVCGNEDNLAEGIQ